MGNKKKRSLTTYQQTIRDLSERIVQAQRPIRLLDAIKWDPSIKEDFFKNNFKKLPAIDRSYYERLPLAFDPATKNDEFYEIELAIRRHLGQFSPVGNIMQRICREYREVVRMINARGESEFSKISQELYGSSEDVFYAGAPSLNDLAQATSHTLANMENYRIQEIDDKIYTSADVVAILQERMSSYFHTADIKVHVKLSDGIIADAAAGADTIRIRCGGMYSAREIRIFEVHEGWVHMGTTLNGAEQPICTFLSKGPPSSTITQEGLAIILEVFTFASYPRRVKKLTDRITAVNMIEKGANFFEVFRFFLTQGYSEDDSYGNTTRVFRGSIPTGGPFTKDLTYSKGFILIYNFLRLAIRRGLLSRIPLLFLGKTTLEDLRTFSDLIEEEVVIPPKFIPPQFKDLSALTAWMTYSNFLNRFNLERVENDYKDVL